MYVCSCQCWNVGAHWKLIINSYNVPHILWPLGKIQLASMSLIDTCLKPYRGDRIHNALNFNPLKVVWTGVVHDLGDNHGRWLGRRICAALRYELFNIYITSLVGANYLIVHYNESRIYCGSRFHERVGYYSIKTHISTKRFTIRRGRYCGSCWLVND